MNDVFSNRVVRMVSQQTRLAFAPDLLRRLMAREPVVWLNPGLGSAAVELGRLSLSFADLAGAARRWTAFAPLLARSFPELVASGGIIESPLRGADGLCAAGHWPSDAGTLLVKADHTLPVAGSIKARGGIYEVLLQAEHIARSEGLLGDRDTDLLALGEPRARACLARYRIVVGSTGNLGYGVGVAARAIGLQAEVHMSADAKEWKKERLRRRGVTVVEHGGDFTTAVAAARARAQSDPHARFIDDEHSEALFLGYAVAGLRMPDQLQAMGVQVDAERPLIVYVPCGVGGAPSGITFGLKHAFGDHVQVFFVEPVASPCMLVQLVAGRDRVTSVYDIGLDNRTLADGLAVGSASLLAASMAEHLVTGCVTVTDSEMLHWLRLLHATEGMRLEPSAAAAFAGASRVLRADRCQQAANWLRPGATHVAWTTGGSLVPDAEFLPLLDAAH